ncbi:MAG: MBL fold metallo-hydrolase [Pseudomonadota bacterium]
MVTLPHNNRPEFEYGVADQLSASVRRVICNNPGPFTFTGTGTYLIGHGEVAVIDPGPADQTHIDALLHTTRGEEITHILVTHTHVDHSPGCALLQQHCGAKTYAYAPHGQGGFGADMEFQPDELLADGQQLQVGGLTIEAVYTPGHAANHLSFYLPQENALFCGDVVMGWSSTIVVPPDGNMKAYMASLERLMQRSDALYYPTHGAPLHDPQHYVRALHAHRCEREQQVLQCLANAPCSIAGMVPQIYADLSPAMYPAAEQSLLATVEYLVEKGQVQEIVTDNNKTYQRRVID